MIITVGGLDVNVGLDKRNPFFDKRAQFVTSQVHAVEVSDNIVTLYILAAQLYFSECLVLVFVEVSEVDLEHTSLQAIGSNLCSLGTSDKSLACYTLSEHGWGLDAIPFLLLEWILGFLLASLLGLCQTFVLTWEIEHKVMLVAMNECNLIVYICIYLPIAIGFILFFIKGDGRAILDQILYHGTSILRISKTAYLVLF